MGNIAIVGAGNVGQAIAGHMTLLGHDVRLYSRWERDFEAIIATGGIELSGDVEGRADETAADHQPRDGGQGRRHRSSSQHQRSHMLGSLSSLLRCWSRSNWWFSSPVCWEVPWSSRGILPWLGEPSLPDRGNANQPLYLPPARPCQGLHRSHQASGAPGHHSPYRLEGTQLRLSPYFGNRYVDGTDTLSVGLGKLQRDLPRSPCGIEHQDGGGLGQASSTHACHPEDCGSHQRPGRRAPRPGQPLA
jgi:opine dehydrogenase